MLHLIVVVYYVGDENYIVMSLMASLMWKGYNLELAGNFPSMISKINKYKVLIYKEHLDFYKKNIGVILFDQLDFSKVDLFITYAANKEQFKQITYKYANDFHIEREKRIIARKPIIRWLFIGDIQETNMFECFFLHPSKLLINLFKDHYLTVFDLYHLIGNKKFLLIDDFRVFDKLSDKIIKYSDY